MIYKFGDQNLSVLVLFEGRMAMSQIGKLGFMNFLISYIFLLLFLCHSL